MKHQLRARFALMGILVLFLGLAPNLVLAQSAGTNPFSGIETKLVEVLNVFKNVVGVVLAALLVWAGIDLARGSGQAWVKALGALVGFILLSQLNAIVSFFTGYTLP